MLTAAKAFAIFMAIFVILPQVFTTHVISRAAIIRTTSISCPPGKYTHIIFKSLSSNSSVDTDSCTDHTKCPPGKYTKAAGSVTAQPECRTCVTGSFKAFASSNSTGTDSCLVHTKCPAGKYTATSGSITAQPRCQACVTGLFKAVTSSNSTEQDSCDAHTKCPPGKYTTTAGSITAQPKCQSCPAGLFKAITSRSSMCAGTASKHRGEYLSTVRCATIFACFYNSCELAYVS